MNRPSPPKVADPGAPVKSPPTVVGLVHTAAGVACVRITRYSVLFHLGGHGEVPTHVYEAEVRTPRSIRERQGRNGWVDLGEVRDGWRPAGSFIEAYWLVAGRLEAAAASRTTSAPAGDMAAAGRGGDSPASAPAYDRPPRRSVRVVRPSLPGSGGPAIPASGSPPAPPAGRYRSPGHALHAVLGCLRVEDHYAFASSVLGRTVTSLNALDREERRCVQEAAEAAADRRRAA